MIPSVHPAGTDPAYVPGLVVSRPAEVARTTSQPAAELPPEDTLPEDARPEDAVSEDAVSEDAASEETIPEAVPEEPAGAEEEADGVGDCPVFEVSDRRGSITADRTGITFRLDAEEAEFRWDEIGAVEVDTPRFGRRFTVTVYTTTRRWYEADVEASARSLLKNWTAELDAVLDACFEESAL
jgi:hypothetical protein